MKKTLIILCLIACLLISGCSYGKDSQAIKSLNAQIENIENNVSADTTNEILSIASSPTIDANTTIDSIQSYKSTTYNNLNQETALKNDILSINTNLKSWTSKPYKLNLSQANSIIIATNNINKNISKLDGTINSVKSNVNQIKKNLNHNDISLIEAQSNFISLNNDMNERISYLSNIFANLEHIYRILELELDSQQNQTTNAQATNDTNTQNEELTQHNTNIDSFSNNRPFPIQNTQNASQNYPYNPNYQNYTNMRFNPNRNTDSFYARFRNIDTYRYNPNGYYNNYNNRHYQNGYYYN